MNLKYYSNFLIPSLPPIHGQIKSNNFLFLSFSFRNLLISGFSLRAKILRYILRVLSFIATHTKSTFCFYQIYVKLLLYTGVYFLKYFAPFSRPISGKTNSTNTFSAPKSLLYVFDSSSHWSE